MVKKIEKQFKNSIYYLLTKENSLYRLNIRRGLIPLLFLF